MTEETIEDMGESVTNADQNVALDIHVEMTVTVVNIKPIFLSIFLPLALVVPNISSFFVL